MTSVQRRRAFLRQVVAVLAAPTAIARQAGASPPATRPAPAVDVLPRLLDGAYPLAGDHDLDRVVEGQSVYFLKFGNQPGPDPARWPYYERWGWDERWIYHLEDHPAPDRAYRFRGDRRWLPRVARAGDTFVVDTEKVDYARDADGAWHQVGARPWRYRIRVEQADPPSATSPGRVRWVYDPRLGERPRDDGSPPGEYERFFASDGWHAWESWKTPAARQSDERTQHATFDRPRAGRSLRPDASVTGAAWWASDLLPPRITITDWAPRRGPAPLRVLVHWQASPGSGPLEAVEIECRRLGESRWSVADAGHAGATSHVRVVTLPAGTFEIRAIGRNAAGRDITARQRLVEVR